MSDQERILSCADCHAQACQRKKNHYPQFCLTTNTDQALQEQVQARYQEDPQIQKTALTAAQIEGELYGKATRVAETLEFIKRMGYAKVGVATCMGLIQECQIFAEIARSHGIALYSVVCKVGSTDKTAIGVAEQAKIRPGHFEPMCNPVLQAELLNQAGCDFNLIIGLCVGHDTLFIQHSQAPVSCLIVKDRVLCHNPAGALYNAKGYYKRLYAKPTPK